MGSEGCAVIKRRKSQSELTPNCQYLERKSYLPDGEKEDFIFKHFQISEGVRVCFGRFTQSVIKTMPVSFSTKGNYSCFVDVYLHVT
jgi:hypothetical protein